MENEGGEVAENSAVKGNRGKQKKKKRAEDERHAKGRMMDSDLSLVSSRVVKHRGRNSLASNEEEFEGKDLDSKC